MAEESLILRKLEKLEKEVKEIRQRMVDADCIMTEEDYTLLLDYRREKEEGQLTSHEQLKKELGL